ncbi:uncharacterized protein [Halyomorpha halys]|uniref:uncharacterized protein n=1 Tax=Halyomorpha halys TaxID=286706 RepID=UPI0006D4EE59|nr:uncharacterized protein LOC106682421 [Halyomorpha halys]
MSGLQTSEYRRNFSWTFSDGYRRSCPPDQGKSSNFFYRPNSHDFISASSRIDHKAIARQYMKLNPQLNRNGIRDGIKTDYGMLQSTYKDTFRKHAKYPSMADYIQIANNVTDVHFPDSVKYFYEPEESQECNNSSRNDSNMKTVSVRFPKTTDNDLRDEDMESNSMIAKKSMDLNSPPKITDLGACYYRNDISPECMPRHDSLREYIEETNKKIKSTIRRNEYEEKARKRSNRKPKRYIDLPVY